MTKAARSRLRLEKTEAVGRRGMVATKHPHATRAGLDALESGGNAVDSAVAAAMVVGVAEPWSSGIGGGGYALVALHGTVSVVAFPMQAGGQAVLERYPLDGRAGVGAFLWDGVVNDANYHGHDSMAVPGAVAGLALLHDRFGRLPWSDLLQPAIRLAREGSELTWFDLLVMGGNAVAAQRHAELARVYYPAERESTPIARDPPRIYQPELADTLDAIAREGPAGFYRGDIAAAVAKDSEAHGGVLRREDLAAYQARLAEPLVGTYRGRRICVPSSGCAGPTTIETLNIYENVDVAAHDHGSVDRVHAFLWAAELAQADRFAFMSDPARSDAPWSVLTSKDYAHMRFGSLDPAAAPHEYEAGDARAYADDTQAVARAKSETSTTHLCTADAEGMVVSLTNTIGGAWGSEIVPEGTGVVWNNGMWWFDPVPGRPNSIMPGAFGLNNMSPAIVMNGADQILALGASGGRRITNCVAQLIMHVIDHGMGAQAAIDAPRVDASTPWITIDASFGAPVLGELRRRGWDAVAARDPGRSELASPVLIMRNAEGPWRGGVDVFHSAEAAGR